MLNWPRYDPPAKFNGEIEVPFAGALRLKAADNEDIMSALSHCFCEEEASRSYVAF